MLSERRSLERARLHTVIPFVSPPVFERDPQAVLPVRIRLGMIQPEMRSATFGALKSGPDPDPTEQRHRLPAPSLVDFRLEIDKRGFEHGPFAHDSKTSSEYG